MEVSVVILFLSSSAIYNMGPKTKQSWEKLNHMKRELKKRKTEFKLRKIQDASSSKELPVVVKKQLSTVSIAIPGSILDNAQSPELRTYLAGQIARAACIYQVDEVRYFSLFTLTVFSICFVILRHFLFLLNRLLYSMIWVMKKMRTQPPQKREKS